MMRHLPETDTALPSKIFTASTMVHVRPMAIAVVLNSTGINWRWGSVGDYNVFPRYSHTPWSSEERATLIRAIKDAGWSVADKTRHCAGNRIEERATSGFRVVAWIAATPTNILPYDADEWTRRSDDQ